MMPRARRGVSDTERLWRLEAKLSEAERVLRQTGDPWAALRVLDLVAAKGRKEAVGRRGRSARERADLGDLFARMTAPAAIPGARRSSIYIRMTERRDLVAENVAESWAAQREGRPAPGLPDEAVFEPDCDEPMTPEDALRNVAAYLGRARSTTWKLLRAEDQRRRRDGQKGLDLPRRDPK